MDGSTWSCACPTNRTASASLSTRRLLLLPMPDASPLLAVLKSFGCRATLSTILRPALPFSGCRAQGAGRVCVCVLYIIYVMYMHMHTYTRTHIHAYIHTYYIHTYIHTYMHIDKGLDSMGENLEDITAGNKVRNLAHAAVVR